jgi:hypothetical protein
MPRAPDCTVTFPVERGIFGVSRLARTLNVLARDGRILNWHPGPWVDWRHTAIAISFDNAADAALSKLTCYDEAK